MSDATPSDREAVIRGLERLLADGYTIYLKTHSFHWNVTGPMFATLHGLFEQQYQELWTAVDEIAERIRTLGAQAPGTYRRFAELTSLKEREDVPDAMEMVRELAADHERVAATASAVARAAEEAGDEGTHDLAVGRLRTHEKDAWMLRSHLA